MAGELLSQVHQKILGGKSLSDAAKGDSLEVEETEEFKLNDYISDIGRELKFTAAAFKLQPGELSNPVEGMRGYYLIRLIEKNEADTSLYKTRKEDLSNQILQEKQQLLFSDWLTYLREKATIKDYRSDFFRE